MRRVLVLAVAAAARRRRRHARPGTRSVRALCPGLPAYTAGYKGWIKLNAKAIPPRRSGDAHRGTKNVYASKRIVGRRYAVGTVIVKEIVRPGTRFVGVIAVMRKTRPSSAPNNGWQMVEWERRSTGARFGVLAQGSICTSCHVQAKANDFVFTKR